MLTYPQLKQKLLEDVSDKTEGRPTALKRGYNYEWQKAREEFLKENPWCVRCKKEGKKVKATVVDHVTPHKGNKKLFWDRRRWRPLCTKHHSS